MCNRLERNGVITIPRKEKVTFRTERECFPSRLSQLMQERKVSQAQLGDYIGSKRQTVSLYATGQSKPDIDTLCKISQFFGVSADYLIGRSDSRNPENASAVDELGLSEESVNILTQLRRKSQKPFVREREPEDDELGDDFDFSATRAKDALAFINAFLCDSEMLDISVGARFYAATINRKMSDLRKSIADLEAIKKMVELGVAFEDVTPEKAFAGKVLTGKELAEKIDWYRTAPYSSRDDDHMLLQEYKAQKKFAKFMERYSGYSALEFERLKARMYELRDECRALSKDGADYAPQN